jgi:hypothetical protein
MYELLCGVTPFSQDKKGDIEILNFITSFTPVSSLPPPTLHTAKRRTISRFRFFLLLL